MPLFNAQTARENALKAHQARRLKRDMRDSMPQPEPQNPRSAGVIIDAGVRERKLRRLDAQLDALDDLLDNAKGEDAWHKLTMAKHRLMEHWYILGGIAKPGSRRPPPESKPAGAFLSQPAPMTTVSDLPPSTVQDQE